MAVIISYILTSIKPVRNVKRTFMPKTTSTKINNAVPSMSYPVGNELKMFLLMLAPVNWLFAIAGPMSTTA